MSSVGSGSESVDCRTQSQYIVVPVEVEYLKKAISHQMTLVCSRQVYSLGGVNKVLGGL